MADSLKICFVARNDFESKPGGDTVQFHLYRKLLLDAGLKSVTWFDASPRPKADIYHTFDIDRPLDIYPKMVAVKEAGLPYVISTIHHPMEWMERFRRAHACGIAAKFLYRMPFGGNFPRAESIKEGIRLATGARWREFKNLLPSWRKRVAWLLINADKVLLLSKKEADFYPPDFGVDLSSLPTDVLPNWVDGAGEVGSAQSAEFEGFPEPPVLVVGRIEARKNALRICRLMNETGRYGLFLGRLNPNEREYARDFQKEIAKGAHVRWVPGVPRTRMAAFYEHAAFLLNASYAEVSPMVDIEALKFGCPVVTTRYALHHELLPASTQTCDAWDDQQIAERLSFRPCRLQPRDVIDAEWCREKLLRIYSEVSDGRGVAKPVNRAGFPTHTNL